ncbi:MAG: hypothetical protein ACI9QV_000019 [Methylophagaceae bacterium]|jgi:hypothetical protein
MSEQKDPTIGYIIWSVLCAFFGVSNKENYDRDRAYIEKVGVRPYLYAGIILTMCFALSVWAVVQIVLSNVAA